MMPRKQERHNLKDIISRATDNRFTLAFSSYFLSKLSHVQYRRQVIRAQPSFHDVKVDVEMYVGNEWFSEGPRNQMSYRRAENVDRVLLQTTDEHLRKF